MMRMLFVLLLFTGSALGAPEVPFGDKVGADIPNYDRAAPWLATSGKPGKGGVATLKALGFSSIVDLRTPEEGIDPERRAADEAGISWINIPVGKDAPDDETLARFRKWIEDPSHRPVLVHCASGNRAGTLWALYRLGSGTRLDDALLEGRTAGMKPSRESQVIDYAARLESR